MGHLHRLFHLVAVEGVDQLVLLLGFPLYIITDVIAEFLWPAAFDLFVAGVINGYLLAFVGFVLKEAVDLLGEGAGASAEGETGES